MQNPNDLTIKTYNENFDTYETKTPSMASGELKEWIDAFLGYLPQKASIIELGSATGRDARYIAREGYNVTCTDIIPRALEKLSQEGFDTSLYDFRDEPREEWLHRFDGYFANAVLLHAPQDVFEKALANIPKFIKPGGIAAFSLKTGTGEEITGRKMEAPRYFNYHSEEEVRALLAKLPFEILEISYGDAKKWLHIILKTK